MKTIVLFAGLILCALCLINGIKAVPVGGNDLELVALNAGESSSEQLVTLDRQKRYTCNKLNSSTACSAHCILLGRLRGGYCSGGTCICRR